MELRRSHNTHTHTHARAQYIDKHVCMYARAWQIRSLVIGVCQVRIGVRGEWGSGSPGAVPSVRLSVRSAPC